MTVNITFSETSGGDSIDDSADLGRVVPGEETETADILDLFIRHDATVSPITDCAWYMQRYVGSNYKGVNGEDADLEEILSWGDDASGGIIINQVIPAGWTEGTQFDEVNDQIFKNGYGDIDSQLTLKEDAISIGTPAGDGVIPVSGEAHVQLRVKVPASVPAGAGYRMTLVVFSYSATS
jgi:hypothetical protein